MTGAVTDGGLLDSATLRGLAELVLGLQPLDSAMRLGPALARQLMLLSLDRGDIGWLLASLPFAAWLATRNRRERVQALPGG